MTTIRLAAFSLVLALSFLACQKKEDPYKDLKWMPLPKVKPQAADTRPTRCGERNGRTTRLLRGAEIVWEKSAAEIKDDPLMREIEAEGRLGRERVLPVAALLEDDTLAIEVMSCFGRPQTLAREALLAEPLRFSLWPKPRGMTMLAEAKPKGRGNPFAMRDVYAVRLLREGDAPTPMPEAPGAPDEPQATDVPQAEEESALPASE